MVDLLLAPEIAPNVQDAVIKPTTASKLTALSNLRIAVLIQ